MLDASVGGLKPQGMLGMWHWMVRRGVRPSSCPPSHNPSPGTVPVLEVFFFFLNLADILSPAYAHMLAHTHSIHLSSRCPEMGQMVKRFCAMKRHIGFIIHDRKRLGYLWESNSFFKPVYSIR